ncbi:AraC family transcriptional regulator [Bradyrhizobium sp. JYMT SZCCT0428]|nr:AraC family transcriptional regulator [Bradyrhizobium sp. JYMT SZCCT0428]
MPIAGFNDVSYFHRSFRRRFGMTPLEAKAQQVETDIDERLHGPGTRK